jgi:hypothetical protein
MKITTKLTFANILQKHFNLSNELVISVYYLYYRFLRIGSLKAGFRYKRQFVITEFVMNGFNCIYIFLTQVYNQILKNFLIKVDIKYMEFFMNSGMLSCK